MSNQEPVGWKTLSSNRAFHNRWIGVVVDEVELPDGNRYEYTRVEPAGVGVGVIGFDAAGNILLEREYRHGVGEVIWQMPGGLAAHGEDMQAAGLRELLEETGYAPAAVTPDTVRYLGAVWDNPAMGTAISHTLHVRGLVQVAADPELRRHTGLGDDARVLVINTEGATDPELYAALVGSTPELVLASEGSASS